MAVCCSVHPAPHPRQLPPQTEANSIGTLHSGLVNTVSPLQPCRRRGLEKKVRNEALHNARAKLQPRYIAVLYT